MSTWPWVWQICGTRDGGTWISESPQLIGQLASNQGAPGSVSETWSQKQKSNQTTKRHIGQKIPKRNQTKSL